MMPLCPNCSAPVDIEPAFTTHNVRGLMPRGRGVRCRTCNTVLEFSQWRAFAVKFAPFLLFIAFASRSESTMFERAIVGALAFGPFLVTALKFFPGLYRLRVPAPGREVTPDDELHD